MLNRRSEHMRNLTRDIVQAGKVYEPPLVHQFGTKYVVHDGNRRVTCLKLLARPQTAPTTEWSTFFTEQRANWKGAFPQKIPCRIEKNLEEIDEILYRRHTGTRNGIGQTPWDAEAKSNFERRTGKETRTNVAEEIEHALRDADLLPKGKKIPRSNLNRLLSAEAFRNRVGITINKKKLEFTHEPDKALSALARIAGDLASKRIVLEDIWDNDSKRTYLNALDSEGVLPTVKDALDVPTPDGSSAADQKSRQTDNRNGEESDTNTDINTDAGGATDQDGIRSTLIRQIDYGLVQQAQNQRAMDIWGELKFRLHFGKHDNAISVLFRVLVELAIENYVKHNTVSSIHSNDKLSNRYRKVLDHIGERNLLPANQIKDLRKFQQAEALFSSNTFNSYVHHSNFFPSDHHLKSMWDNLAPFVVVCLKAV